VVNIIHFFPKYFYELLFTTTNIRYVQVLSSIIIEHKYDSCKWKPGTIFMVINIIWTIFMGQYT